MHYEYFLLDKFCGNFVENNLSRDKIIDKLKELGIVELIAETFSSCKVLGIIISMNKGKKFACTGENHDEFPVVKDYSWDRILECSVSHKSFESYSLLGNLFQLAHTDRKQLFDLFRERFKEKCKEIKKAYKIIGNENLIAHCIISVEVNGREYVFLVCISSNKIKFDSFIGDKYLVVEPALNRMFFLKNVLLENQS